MLLYGGKYCCLCEDEEQLQVQKQFLFVFSDEVYCIKEEWYVFG